MPTYVQVRSNVTYTRLFNVRQLASLLGNCSGCGIFIEFGGVAHAAEVYATLLPRSSGQEPTPTLLGRHYGTMMPFSVDARPLAQLMQQRVDEAGNSTIQLTVVAIHWSQVYVSLGLG